MSSVLHTGHENHADVSQDAELHTGSTFILVYMCFLGLMHCMAYYCCSSSYNYYYSRLWAGNYLAFIWMNMIIADFHEPPQPQLYSFNYTGQQSLC